MGFIIYHCKCYEIIKLDRKHRANDTSSSRVRKHRVISQFEGNLIQNHFDPSDGGTVHKFLLHIFVAKYNF